MGKRVTTYALIFAFLAFPALLSARYAGYYTYLRSATKDGRVYSMNTWDAKLLWNATFFSDKFRKNFSKKHAEVNYLNPEEASNFAAEQDQRQKDLWEFHVGMYTKDAYKNFTAYQDSFWKVLMTTESGEVVEPLEVESLPIIPYESVMFPYIDRWSKAYRVTFPKVDIGQKVSLTIRSVVGESTLTWKVSPSSDVSQK